VVQRSRGVSRVESRLHGRSGDAGDRVDVPSEEEGGGQPEQDTPVGCGRGESAMQVGVVPSDERLTGHLESVSSVSTWFPSVFESLSEMIVRCWLIRR
jgi:hypothetical protein